MAGRLSTTICWSSTTANDKAKTANKTELKKANTPIGRLDDKWEGKGEQMNPKTGELDPYAAFPEDKNPETGEIGGPKGPEPTRYGDWERKGRVIDF